jgi:hypothetical protein
MKAFWSQGGLHIEPETKEERNALLVLWNLRKIEARAEMPEPPAVTLPRALKESEDRVVAD